MYGMKVKADELNLIKLAPEYADEDKARRLFESWRWPGGKPICPHCKPDEAYKIESKPETKNPARLGLYGCAACRKTFTATVGTVLEDSHIPISKGLIAILILVLIQRIGERKSTPPDAGRDLQDSLVHGASDSICHDAQSLG